MSLNRQAAKELALTGGSILGGSALGALALLAIPPATLAVGCVGCVALASVAIPLAFLLK